MATRSIRRVGLDDGVVAGLCACGLSTPGDVFAKTELQLVPLLDLSMQRVDSMLDTVASAITRPPKTAEALLAARQKEPCFIATGLPTIDAAMQGGFPSGMITELVGTAGIGKTQTCLTLAVQCCLPSRQGGLGSDAGVIYLDTEGKFSAQRLAQVAQSRVPSYYDPAVCPQGAENLKRLLDQTTRIQIDNAQDLLPTLNSLQPTIINGKKRIIILDSVAALARKDFSESESLSRQQSLTEQAKVLKHLADTYQLVVLVTNQITTRFGPDVYQVDIGGDSGGLTPALGNTWHHCVSNRLILRECAAAAAAPPHTHAHTTTAAAAAHSGGSSSATLHVDSSSSKTSSSTDAYAHAHAHAYTTASAAPAAARREMTIAKSPLAPIVSCSYRIAAGGIVELEETEEESV